MGRGNGLANSSAPYFAALRAAERRVLKAAYDELGSFEAAAAALGISVELFGKRSRALGGVTKNSKIKEPVLSAQSLMETKIKEPSLSAQPATKPEHDVNGNGHDPAQRISVDPGSENESGAGNVSAETTDRASES